MTSALHIHSDLSLRHSPHAVLVFPVINGRVVWVKHPVRGWEPPGGKVEAGETPDDGARREAWEEAGTRLRALNWVCEYALPGPAGLQYKWVYIADVDDIGARPDFSETVDVGIMPADPRPESLTAREDVSFILKDSMYVYIWPILQQVLREHETGDAQVK